MNLNLTDEQRLILANQYTILSHLDAQNAADHARRAKQLMEGHGYFFRDPQELYEVMDQAEERFVLDILSLYDVMAHSYRDLTDKAGIDASVIQWPGFDGNNETTHLGFAEALREDGRFTTIMSGDQAPNSHMPMLDMYERMLAKWEELGKPRGKLTKEQIGAVLEAQRFA